MEEVFHRAEKESCCIRRSNGYSTKTSHENIEENILNREFTRLFGGEVRSNEEFKEMIKAILPLYTVEQNEEAMKKQLDSIYFHYETHNEAFKVNKKHYDVSDRLHEITCPVLITVGIHDWVTPVEYSDEMAAKIPNNTYVKFENSGHSPHIEENEKYLQVVRKFLKEQQ